MNSLSRYILLIVCCIALQGPSPARIKTTTESPSELVITKIEVDTHLVDLPGSVAECAGVGNLMMTLRNGTSNKITAISYDIVLVFKEGEPSTRITTPTFRHDLSKHAAGLAPSQVQTLERKFSFCESDLPLESVVRIQRVEYEGGSNWERKQTKN